MKKVMNVLTTVLLVIMVLVVLFLFASRIMGETPSLFGYYVFHVTSDSMEPTLKVGDVILVHETDAEDIHKNDIITFRSKDGSMYGREVTHRVVTDPLVKNEEYYYQTQGDAQGAPLDRAITYDQVKGKFVRKLGLLTLFYGFLSKPVGVVVFIGVIVLLFGYEMISLIISYKKVDEKDEKLFDMYLEEKTKIGKSEDNAKEKTDGETEEKQEEKNKE